jgi:hypothetical protein
VDGWLGGGGFRGKERRHFEDLTRFGVKLSCILGAERFGFGMSNFHGGCVCRCVCFFMSLCFFE